ncbi:hypothetical protein Taro_047130 [Colocasia esculenta]|uniref:Protein phosphatase n=1 Tax=Colocasia esculenta TaxID=4460 RepID=A0A843WUF5_COLES|nr:hypothetical protein [Colocasia esculenta]
MENPMPSSPPAPLAALLRRKRPRPEDVPAVDASTTRILRRAIAAPKEEEKRPPAPKRQYPRLPAPARPVRPRDSTASVPARSSVAAVPLWGKPTAAPVGVAPKAKLRIPRLKLDLGSFYVAKEGVHPRGEDAHFLNRALNAFGVADGVGGWTAHGIDAGMFSRQLMSLCEVELVEASCRRTSLLLEGLLERALARTTARGTSTACIAVVDGQLLRAVNIGDSGFLVVRGDKVVYRSATQQSHFNRPYQVGRVDKGDPPASASRTVVRIAPGDIIVAGTDGLFDNLFHEEIVEVLAEAKADGHGAPEDMARALAWAAVEAYLAGEETPFSVACRKAKLSWNGSGKPDDVTVVVARVW